MPSSTRNVVSNGWASFLTYTENYDRNHGPIPHIRSEDHVVVVEGLVSMPLKLSLHALANDFPQHRVACALQCAGNRRHSMRTRVKEVQGIDWFDGAIMNCVWEGPRLREVLLAAGVTGQEDGTSGWSGNHVHFACYQTKCREAPWYGGSVPLERAMRMNAEVLLALKVSGGLLSSDGVCLWQKS